MVTSVGFAALASVYAKRLTGQMPITAVMFYRFFIPIFLWVPILLLINRQLMKPPARFGPHFLRAVFSAATVFAFTYSLSLVSISISTSILYLYPFLVYLIDSWDERRALSMRQLAYIFVGFLGMLLCVYPFSGTITIGVAFAFLAACLISLRIFAEKKIVLSIGPIGTSFWGTILSAAVLLPFAIPTLGSVPKEAIANLLIFAILGTASQTAVIGAIFYGSISRLAPLGYVEIVFSILFAFMFFADLPSVLQLSGMMLILFCGIVVSFRKQAA